MAVSRNHQVPNNWILSKGSLESNNHNGQSSGYHFSSDLPSEFELSQRNYFKPGEYFLMAKISVDLSIGEFYLKVGEKGIRISGSEITCDRTQFTFAVFEPGEVEVAFGVTAGSIGDVQIESIRPYKIEYLLSDVEDISPQLKVLQNQLGLIDDLPDDPDPWIDSMAHNINRAFLESDSERGQGLLMAYQSDVFADSSTRYLNKFMNNVADKSAYCQKSSLSLDEIIRSFGIQTRQLHWEQDCSGIHQFLEYWNEEDKAWKIIDPFYGIRYIDTNGEYIGFEKVEALVRSGNFSPDNIKRINIGKLYYSEEEIMAGWQVQDLAIRINNWE